MLIAQISDTHIVGDGAQREARLGDLARCVADINALDRAPDLVIHSGDVVHTGSAEEYALSRQILDRLRAPLCVLPGNKDDRAVMREFFADRIPATSDARFIQYAIDADHVRLLVLDTVSENSNKGAFCAARLEHLERLLAEGAGRPTLIFMHHPPFEVTAAPDPFAYDSREDVERLSGLLTGRGEIKGLLCGHMHRAETGTFAGIGGRTLPSVAIDLRKGIFPPEADRHTFYALHEFDRDGTLATELRMEQRSDSLVS